MKNLFLTFLAPCLLFAVSASAAGEKQPSAERLDALRSRLDPGVAALDAQLKASKPEPVTRELAAGALAHVMLYQDAARARELIEKVFIQQNIDPASPKYGDVPWQMNHPEIDDPNAIQFTSLPLAALFIKYGDLFPSDFRDEARPRLTAALAAVKSKSVPVWYTNIFLMKMANMILLGEYLGDTNSVNEGKAGLQQWLDFTAANGITEFNSAVYAGVQLDVLHLLYNLAKDADARRQAGLALDYLWADAAANYFSPSEAMAGSSSRSYSFLNHDLNLNQYYYLFGYQDSLPARVGDLSGEVYSWANGVWGGYAPSEALWKLSREPRRVVRQRVGSEPGKDRYTFITPSFALGSSSFFYEHQDRQISLMLNSAKKLPVISVVLDPFNSPYGKVTILETHGGHRKVMHLRNEISAVQEEGAVLALIDLASEATKRIGGSVATNVILPLKADGLYLEGKPVTWEKDTIPVPADSVIGIREGRAAVAIRIFLADGAMPDHPMSYLKNDGARYGAGRLVVYHSRGKEGITTVRPLRSGVIVLAAECETNEDFAKFLENARAWKVTSSQEGQVWQAAASGPSPSKPGEELSLSASIDLGKKQTGERKVNDRAYDDKQVFSVNGENLAARVFSETSKTTPQARAD
jgi:hypothetical protein